MGTSWGRASPRAGPRRQARQEGGKVEPCSRSGREAACGARRAGRSRHRPPWAPSVHRHPRHGSNCSPCDLFLLLTSHQIHKNAEVKQSFKDQSKSTIQEYKNCWTCAPNLAANDVHTRHQTERRCPGPEPGRIPNAVMLLRPEPARDGVTGSLGLDVSHTSCLPHQALC